jgi:NTP pyrophosphatase (non-canonical NTP hydrolase)
MRDNKETLYCLMEECAEVTQVASKILRFGENDHSPLDPLKVKNSKRLEQELGDILGVIDVLIKECTLDLSFEGLEEAKQKKIDKLEIYLPKK